MNDNPTYYRDDKLRITGGPVGQMVQVTFGGKIIPVSKAVIWIEAGELVTAELTIPAAMVDIMPSEAMTKLLVEHESVNMKLNDYGHDCTVCHPENNHE